MRQGDSLSPILFASFINDLGREINELNAGIETGDKKLNLLMYADDIICLAPGHREAQKQMDVLSKWCNTWGMCVNVKKTQVVHVRHHQKHVCKKPIFCMGQTLTYTRTYKYLGYFIQEHLFHDETVEILTKSSKQAFGKIINIFYKLKDMGYMTYRTLFTTSIQPIANYASGVWGYKDYAPPRMLQSVLSRYPHIHTNICSKY